MFSGVIISSIVKDASIKKTAEYQLLLGSIVLPGVFLGAFFCNRIGRKNVMMIGFAGYLVFGLIIGLSYDRITKIIPLFVVFYGLMQSSGNFGPGDMLGLLSSESYATGVRGTCYGVSAAFGKAGAAVGTELFTLIQNNSGNAGPSSLQLFAALSEYWSHSSSFLISRTTTLLLRTRSFGLTRYRSTLIKI